MGTNRENVIDEGFKFTQGYQRYLFLRCLVEVSQDKLSLRHGANTLRKHRHSIAAVCQILIIFNQQHEFKMNSSRQRTQILVFRYFTKMY